MPVSLSIKNAPDEMVKRLKERAERHHRSLQGELMAILEEAAGTSRRTDARRGPCQGAADGAVDTLRGCRHDP